MSMNRGKTYNIVTVDAVNLGAEHNNLKLNAIIDYADALKIKDIYSLNNDISANVEGLTKDLSKLDYYKFEKLDGTFDVYASTWIDSYEEVTEGVVANVRLTNLTNEDLNNIRKYLLSADYKFEINIE